MRYGERGRTDNKLVIHKQTISILVGAIQQLSVPAGSLILDYQVQGGVIQVWYEFELGHSTMVPLQVFIQATGHETSPAMRSRVNYATTVQMGDEVWHIFDHLGKVEGGGD